MPRNLKSPQIETESINSRREPNIAYVKILDPLMTEPRGASRR